MNLETAKSGVMQLTRAIEHTLCNNYNVLLWPYQEATKKKGGASFFFFFTADTNPPKSRVQIPPRRYLKFRTPSGCSQ
ncbi:hypothetical protein JOB18_036921 [Solea senegalensis]|uniref:Uncharacterized protein n=1 Tax=Solea senegalensis TaxID=28829 RepID=A0AAV6R8L7_SOLSE|nr:hypothetical protein JOB18_036921 [Solea senegalensis]